MSNNIVVMRHAKSVQPAGGLDDFERKLANEGVGQARDVAVQMKQVNFRPGLVLCSNAVRTTETWQALERVLGKTTVNFENGLYNSGLESYLNLIADTPASVDNLLIIGHNPTVSDLCSRLGKQVVDMQTADAIWFEFNGLWSDISTHAGQFTLKTIIRPSA